MLTLLRLCQFKIGVQGVFIWNNSVVCHSLELPWLNNVPERSCIPYGTYMVVKEMHPRFGSVFRLPFVIGRSGILIHPGNSIHDTKGCILPGLDIDDSIGIKSSRSALQRLYDLLPTSTSLIIKEF